MQNLRFHPDLQAQNFHFSKIPQIMHIKGHMTILDNFHSPQNLKVHLTKFSNFINLPNAYLKEQS
jgi:hypothetical protein